MDFDDIIINLKCVDMDLPPLANNASLVSDIITSMPSASRKKANRKIKKLCKKYINVSVSHLKEPIKSFRKSVLEKRLRFKTDEQLFNKVVLERRIIFVRDFMLREERRNSNETGKP